MNAQHKKIFFDAAERYECIIGLRDPNPLYEKWMGRSGYKPKAAHIKAKTADNASHPFGGLVVSPFLCPEAFLSSSLQGAKMKWSYFAAYTQISNSPSGWFYVNKEGLLLEEGMAIYPDFDLMFICKAGKNGEILPTSREEAKLIFRPVQEFINMRIGSPMIQHGPELDYDGVGAKEEEWILNFGPSRKSSSSRSYFHTAKNKVL